MANLLEKVMKGQECISGAVVYCNQCGYSSADGSGRGDRCKRDCAKDALSLLRAYHQKKIECEQCASKTSAPIESLQDKLKESRISLKEIMDESLTELIETNRLKPPRVLTIDDMQATKKGQFLWIECLGGELYCMEAVQVCKANGKVTEISINAPRFIYELTMKNYNIGWRAWDSQPTPAMMEAMPWKI